MNPFATCRRSRPTSQRPLRFTLIELLVVVAIVSVLAAMLLPALTKARDRTRRTLCLTNQRQTYLALSLYADDHAEYVPAINPRSGTSYGDSPRYPYSWDEATLVKKIMPYGFRVSFLVCPSQEQSWSLINPKPGVVVTDSTNPHYRDYVTSMSYWPGMAQQNESAHVERGVWYDSPTVVASTRLLLDPNKLVLSDLNIYATSGFASLNHSRGRNIWRVGEVSSIVEVTSQLAGGNRLFADGHGEWVTPSVMGKNNTPIATSPTQARYSHILDGSRPYWF